MTAHHDSVPIPFAHARRPGVRLAGAAFLLLLGCSAPRPAPLAGPSAAPGIRRAILVSFDALSERRARETIPGEAIPAFGRLFSGGACADHALPAWPSKTSASHASIWTGAYGDVNGVAANWQPFLPRDEHTIAEGGSGYAASALRAEPIWAAAARAGIPVVGHHPTQAPGDAHGPHALVLNGYNRHYAPDLAITAETARPRPAIGWRRLELLASTVPPREIAWSVGSDSIFALLYGHGRYAEILVSRERDAGTGVRARVAPVEAGPSSGRPLARHFSEPLVLDVPEGRAYLRVRVFHLAPDGSGFLIFQPALSVVMAQPRAMAAAYADAIGGWVGNGARDLLLDGEFGPTLAEGGGGEAELRYLESLELVTRQFMRGSEWAWARGARLLLDYFPLIDEVDHMWLGYLEPAAPGYRHDLAGRIQGMRERAWRLADRRLAALEGLVEGDSGAALFVTGDHGMRPTWRAFRPNVALAQAGLLGIDDSGRVDVARTRAYSPDGLYIMVNSTDWRGGVVAPDSVEAAVAAAERAILSVRGEDGAPVVTLTWRVLGGDSLGRGGPVGGQLYYETAAGYAWRRDLTGDAAGPGRIGADHGYPSISPDMHTVFCAFGPALPPGRLGPARTIDAAPTVSDWLGIAAPRDARGRSLLGAISEPSAR